MIRSDTVFGAVVTVLSLALPLAAQPPVPEKTLGDPPRNVGVKNWTQRCGTSVWYEGVVEKVEGGLVTWTCDRYGSDQKPKSRTMEATKVLAEGGLAENVSGGWAYLWSDLQKGDTVVMDVVRDTEEDKLYVQAVKIDGRKGGKVPPSQRPKGDEERLGKHNVLNDINNGLDVDDDEIAKWFPTRHVPHLLGETPPPPIPGGLNKAYQAKLDAIRAKKKDDPKAPPPEKK